MDEQIRNEGIYLASVDLLRRLLRDGLYEKCILERLNCLNAKSMNCKVKPHLRFDLAEH
jgi:hypothetical protein